MYVEFGNDSAIEAYRDPTSTDPDRVMYRAVEGQHITRVVFPEGIGLQEAYANAVAALGHHIEPGQKPSWIESDNTGLRTLLLEHFDISKASRPPTWGKIENLPKKTTKKQKG